MLRALLGKQLSRLIRHVCFLAERFQLVALPIRHHRFFWHYITPAFSRVASIILDASAFDKLSLNALGVPACSQSVSPAPRSSGHRPIPTDQDPSGCCRSLLSLVCSCNNPLAIVTLMFCERSCTLLPFVAPGPPRPLGLNHVAFPSLPRCVFEANE